MQKPVRIIIRYIRPSAHTQYHTELLLLYKVIFLQKTSRHMNYGMSGWGISYRAT